MSNWEVRLDSTKNLMLESIRDNVIIIPKIYFTRLSKNEILSDEISEYNVKHRDLKKKLDEVFLKDPNNSRRAYLAWNNSPEGNSHCISSVQLLSREQTAVLNVYMRSSNLERFRSDVGFLARIAQEYEVDVLQIYVGSLHLYLESNQ
ncbi:MAG: hypothetical protein AAB958_02420 [Patescibacteria group bacterium]